MRRVFYLFLFAIAFLIFKAFFLDDYLAEHYYKTDANATVETNVSEEVPQPVHEPEIKPVPNENNLSGMSADKEKKKKEAEDKKMPLDRLGDKLSEHIKL